MRTYTTREQIQAQIEILEFNPDSFDNLHSQATEYVLEKDYQSCLNILNKIEEIHGSTSQTYLQKGICLYRLGYIKNAIDELEQALVLDETSEQALTLLPKLKERLDNLRNYCMVQFYG